MSARRLAAVCATLLAAGCSPRGEAEGGRSIVWLVPAGPDRPLIERVAAGIERDFPGANVETVFVPVGQYQSKLKLLVAAGRAPDVACLGDVWIGPLAPRLLDLGPFLARDGEAMGLSDFPAPLIGACRWEGVIRCLPRSFHVSLVYYNRRLFDEAGEPYPDPGWSLEDYRRVAARLTRGEGDAAVWGTGLTTGWWGEWLALVRAFGGELLDGTGRRCLLREAPAREGLAFYRGKISPPAIAPKPGRGPEGDFASGRVAMDYGGHTSLWPVYRRVPGLDWDILPLPVGPGGENGAELALDAVVVFEGCRDTDLAWELVKRLLSPESVAEAAALGAIPPRMSVARATLLAPGWEGRPRGARHLYGALEKARPVPRHAAFTELAIDVIQPEIDRVMAGSLDAGKAAERASEGAEALLRAVGEGR